MLEQVKLTNEEVLELLIQFRRLPEQRLRDRLTLAHSWLVEKIARKFLASGEPLEDLIQEGNEGLLAAIDRFDPNLQVKFITYATWWIAGEIRHYLRDSSKIIAQPGWHQGLHYRIFKTQESLMQDLGRQPEVTEIASALNLKAEVVENVLAQGQVFQVESLDALLAGEDDSGRGAVFEPVSADGFDLEQVENRLVVRQAIARLPSKQRAAVIHSFYYQLTKTEIARLLGISNNYVGYLLKRALKSLRGVLELQEGQAVTMPKSQPKARKDLVATRSVKINAEGLEERKAEGQVRAENNSSESNRSHSLPVSPQTIDELRVVLIERLLQENPENLHCLGRVFKDLANLAEALAEIA